MILDPEQDIELGLLKAVPAGGVPLIVIVVVVEVDD
jgi:hypothetical protein